MNISNLTGSNLSYLQKTMGVEKEKYQEPIRPDKGNGFAELLQDGIETLNREQLVAENHKRDIATGEVEDLQKAIIEIDRASLSITLAGEVKNKVLSAYKEIMNTQI